MAEHNASPENPVSRTASPSAEAMELGFQANLGPLSQIGIQLISPSTAVYFATKGLGWWKARGRVESLQQVLGASDAHLVPLEEFNAEEYSRVRRQHPPYGVVRQGTGRVESHALPVAGNIAYIAYKDRGLWCLYAMTTALLCFFDVDGACSILIDVVPQMLHYEQQDREVCKEGPLHSALKTMIVQVFEEEMMTKSTEKLLRLVDEKREKISPASLQDIQGGMEFDSNLVRAFLLWLATPFSKREKHQYPTRSLLVWAIAEILSEQGFVLRASEDPVTSRLQYDQIFSNEDIGLEVHFVAANVGQTDPNARPDASITVIPHVRLLPIRSIPITELQQHCPTQHRKLNLGTIWSFTFDHVQNHLKKQSHIQAMIGSVEQTTEDQKTPTPTLTIHQHNGLLDLSRPHSRSSPESLTELLALPIQKWIDKDCADCANPVQHRQWEQNWCWLDSGDDETAEHRKEHNKVQKLTMRTILLAAAYAIVCLFVKDENGMGGLDSEVAYVPSKGAGISDCFSLESEDREWMSPIFSIAAVGKAQKNSTRTDSGRVLFTKAIFGAVSAGFGTQQFIGPGTFGTYANGLTIVSKLLLEPAHPSSYHTFVVSFGHPIDLPLDEYSFISSVSEYSKLKMRPFELLESLNDNDYREEDQNDQIRWDIDPDWANSETEIQFRGRIGGVLHMDIAPIYVMHSLQKSSATLTPCECASAGQPSTGQHTTPDLADYRQSLNIKFVPFRSIRLKERYMTVSLKLDTNIQPNENPTVVVIRPGANSVEQWLALRTSMRTVPGRVTANIRRYIGPCLSCGLKFIVDNLARDGSIALIVLSQ